MVNGKYHWNWNGGMRRFQDGYIGVHSPTHPFKDCRKYVMEHRLIMEQHLRETNPNHPALIEIDGVKYLSLEWAVHHKNGRRGDNRIENLEVMTVSKHLSFHTTGKKNPNYQKPEHYTSDVREKMSLSHMGSKNSMYGKHRSIGTRRKTSESLKSYYIGDVKCQK